jgi:hypothetical protein
MGMTPKPAPIARPRPGRAIPGARLLFLAGLLALLPGGRAATNDGSANHLGNGLFVANHHLFVAAWGYGLQILDVTDPARPRWVGAWNQRGAANGVFVVGNHAYLANRVAGLEVLDVRDPRRPVSLAHLPTGGDVMGVFVRGAFAVLAEATVTDSHSVLPPAGEGLALIHVVNPAEPRMLGRYAGPNGDYNLAAGTGIPAVARMGRVIYEDRGPLAATPAWHSAHRIVGWGLAGFHLVGDRLYSTSGRQGLRIFDVSDPSAPTLLGELGTSFATWDVRVAGGYAYLMDAGAGIHVVAVDNPREPRVVGAFPSTGYASRWLRLEAGSVADTRGETTSGGSLAIPPIENAPPELRDPRWRADGSFTFVLVGVPHGTYVIQATADWQTWENLSTNTLTASGNRVIEDLPPAGVRERFYRAVRRPAAGD